MAVAEHIMDHLALATSVPVDRLRRLNLYKEGDAGKFRGKELCAVFYR